MMLTDPDNTPKYHALVLEKFINVFMDPAKIKKETSLMPSNSTIVPSKKSA